MQLVEFSDLDRKLTPNTALNDLEDEERLLSVESDDDGGSARDHEEKEPHCVGVNLHFLPAKLFYLTFFGGLGCIFPYLPIYYRFVGLSARQTGIVQAVQPFALFISTPMCGIIGDKFRRTKLIWLFSLCSTILLTSLIAVVRPSAETLELREYCVCNSTITNSSRNNSFAGVQMKDNSLCSSVKSHTHDEGLEQFLPLVALVLFGQLFGSPSVALADYFVLELLGDERQGDYGKQRLWGAAGWGLGAFGAGYASNSNSECDANYLIHFVLFVVICLVAVLFAYLIKPSTKVVLRNEVKICKSLKLILVNPRLCVFLITIWLIANLMAVIDNFLFWFLEDLGGGELVIGLSLLFTCVGEIPVFFISGHIIRRIGHGGVLYLTLLCYALRFFLYSILTNPWTVLPVELLHGITFALMWAASTSFARANAPEGMGASLQTITSGIYWGLGKGCGGVFGGLVWQSVGARQTFRGCAGISLGGLLLFFIAQQILSRKKCKKPGERRLVTSDSTSDIMESESCQENKWCNDLSTTTQL